MSEYFKCDTHHVLHYVKFLDGYETYQCEFCEWIFPVLLGTTVVDELNTRIKKLETENNNLIVKLQFAESVIRDEKQIERAATEAALRWAWQQGVQYDFPGTDQEWVDLGIKVLLGVNNAN